MPEKRRGRSRPGTSAERFIGEIDGSMAPLVEPSATSADRRKDKVLSWTEVRRALAHRHGSASPVFGGHFAGGVEERGRQWRRRAAKAGFGPASHLHGLGDGAPWIANPLERHFGTQGSYLIDFFHGYDYLSAAALSKTAHWTTTRLPKSRVVWLDVIGEIARSMISFLHPPLSTKRCPPRFSIPSA